MNISSFILYIFLLNVITVVVSLIFGYDYGILLMHWSEGGYITCLSFIQLLSLSFLSSQSFCQRHRQMKIISFKSPHLIWLILAVGFFFLAIDETSQIHERYDMFLHEQMNMKQTALTDRLDDALIGLYGLIGVGLLFFYRKEINQYGGDIKYLKAGFVFLFVSVIFDIHINRWDVVTTRDHRQIAYFLEECYKIFSEAFFLVYFYQSMLRIRQSSSS